MALQNVFETHFQNEMQDSYRIRIYDMDYSAGAAMTSLYGAAAGNLPTTLTTRHEGITIEYDGDQAVLAKPIIGSVLQLELLLTNSLDRKIIEAIKERPEHTLGIILYRHNDTNTT